jgi:hypothetical protein
MTLNNSDMLKEIKTRPVLFEAVLRNIASQLLCRDFSALKYNGHSSTRMYAAAGKI